MSKRAKQLQTLHAFEIRKQASGQIRKAATAQQLWEPND
jgi:hypothetical protein